MDRTTKESTAERKKEVKATQQYYYVYQYEGKEEVQEMGDEDRILSIVTEGGKILKIYKLGDEQEVVIKVQKKVSPSE